MRVKNTQYAEKPYVIQKQEKELIVCGTVIISHIAWCFGKIGWDGLRKGKNKKLSLDKGQMGMRWCWGIMAADKGKDQDASMIRLCK